MRNVLRDVKLHQKCSTLGGNRCRSSLFYWFWSTSSATVPHCDSRHGLWTVLFPFAYIPLVPTRFWRRVRG
jgi:hypothetical protein